MKVLFGIFLIGFFMVQCISTDEVDDGRESGSRAVAETTLPAFLGTYDDIDLDSPDDISVCRLRVSGGTFNIRSEPRMRRGNNCGDAVITTRLNNGQQNSVVALGNYRDWIKISSPATRGCEGGFAYVHEKAFYSGSRESDDLRMYRNGECGAAALDPGRTPIPEREPVHPNARARPINGHNYRFPLPRCLGLKHRGGRGEYGAHRIHGRHGGCDYYSPRNTPILAPCSGTVTHSGKYGNAGFMIILKCNDGTLFKFMHLHANRPPRVRSGKGVNAGEVIGGVSNTGNAHEQAPHLHVEYYRPDGVRDDPQKLWACDGESGH